MAYFTRTFLLVTSAFLCAVASISHASAGSPPPSAPAIVHVPTPVAVPTVSMHNSGSSSTSGSSSSNNSWFLSRHASDSFIQHASLSFLAFVPFLPRASALGRYRHSADDVVGDRQQKVRDESSK